MDIFLAQLFGLYFIIVGAIVALRRKSMMPAVSELVGNRPMLLLLAFIELAAGLAIVVAYPAITFDVMGIISLVGWVMLVEGVIYLTLPIRVVQKFVRHFNTGLWYVYGGAFSVVLGLYLAGRGFGYF
ncbi:MAG TPA: hypothetical protein VD967_00255 [Candidatus Paceibacterota bacterium]|nr:hypothetical protein [Candidatus Paceibacterota bacterium]